MSAATTQSLVLSSPSSLSSPALSQRKHHRHYRRRQLVTVKASKSIGKVVLVRESKSNDKGSPCPLLYSFSSQSAFFQAFPRSSSNGGDVSPFAGVVDIAALGLLGVLAYLGNKKSSENVASRKTENNHEHAVERTTNAAAKSK